MLNKQQFAQLREWTMLHARPLERARFACLFEGGDSQAVIDALRPYQNADGGFGNALEADNWNPESSPLTTTTALHILFASGIRSANQMIQDAIDYLARHHHNPETGQWTTILPANNDHPHAPWWTYAPDGDNTWGYNPGAEIAGFMMYYSPKGSPAYEIGHAALQKGFAAMLDKESMESHEVTCFVHAALLLKHAGKTEAFNLDRILKKLGDLALATACLDQTQWVCEYVPEPVRMMNYLDLPDTWMPAPLQAQLIPNAQVLLRALPQDQPWDIPWRWAEYPQQFEVARTHWRGVRIVENLTLLRRLGLLEG